MAKDTAPAQTSQAQPAQLSINEVLGINQRLAAEMSQYMWGHPDAVDPQVVNFYLERMYQFNSMLPPVANGNGQAKDQRKAG